MVVAETKSEELLNNTALTIANEDAQYENEEQQYVYENTQSKPDGDLVIVSEQEEVKTHAKPKKGELKTILIELVVGGYLLFMAIVGFPSFITGVSTAAKIMINLGCVIALLLAMPFTILGVIDLIRLICPSIDKLASVEHKDGSFGPRLTEDVVKKKVVKHTESFRVKTPDELSRLEISKE